TPIPGAINATLSGLAAGDYTVEVTDILSPGNTCSSIATFTISDDLPVYSINAGAVSVTDQSDCVGNGSATVTDVLVDGASNGGVAGFTFTWLDNAGVAIAGAGNAATIAVPLGAGDYSVRAISTTSNCSSIFTVFTVKDISVTPVIALNTSVDNSTCSGAVSNGSITIDVDGSAPAITDFSIQWYAGIGTTAPITGAISATLSGLTAGDYTVEVTDILSPGNTCSSIATFTISDDLPVYTINSAAVTVTDQTDCVANGSATITDILIDGVSNGGVAGFTFSWLDNTGAAIAGAGSAATIAVPLGAGDFRVMATNTASNCSSIISTFTVLDVSVKPLITVNTLADNSNCSGTTPNGSITIDVDGATPAATDFFIQWYTGNGTTAPIPGAITPTVSGLAAGDYTVEVLDILSPGNTCSTIATITIVDDFPVYSIGSAYILIDDQTDCVGNGSATVGDVLIDGVPNSGVAGFTFTWFDNAGVAIAGAGNAATIAVPLTAGNYSVMTTNTASTCSSIIKVFTVNDLSVTPVIAVNNLTNNSNCGGPASSGSITIDVDGSAPSITDFTIQWYTGIGTTAPIAGATTATLSALAAGDYTVEVTDILSPGNTCSSVATFTVVDALPTYLIIPPALNITHQSDCSANGSAAVTDVFIDNVSNGGVAGFTFAWLDNSGIAIPGAGNGATIAVPLAAGDYRVMATNTTTACNSIITIFTVQDISVSPVIAVNTLTDNSNCGGVAANGSITIDVDGGAPPATDFSIQWYTGTGTTAPIAGATTATLSGLAAGDYTVEVIDILSPGNTCSSVATFTIIDDLPVYAINTTAVTVTDQSDCVANGSATITDVLIDGASNGGVAGFTFDWLDNAGAAIAGAGNAPTIAVPLAAGDYRVMATNTASNCASIITAFTVKDVSVQPLIAANTLIDNSNCSGAAANGSITITANGAAPIATDFSIQWYTGTGTTTPIPGATTATISGLAAGDYTSEVIDILSPGNTCSSVATFTITDDLPLYSINPTAVTVTDQSDCVANGSATITDVLIDGISNGGVTGFTFNWLDNAGAAIAGAGSAAIIAVPLAAGDYRVMATSTASNCSSVITVFTVKDISIKPIIAVNTLIDNSNCSGAASNGSITIDVDGAAPIASDFSIQWYTGTGTTAPILGSTTATLSGLATGDYTVEVIDILSPGNTCASVATFTITDDLPVYAINAAAVTITDQSDCVANGSATITDLLIDGVSNGGVAGFTFNWLDDASAVIPGAGNAATIAVPLAAGNYSIMAINTASNCSSVITVFTVKDISIKPVISVNTLIDNSNCSGVAADGSITINVDGAAPVATDFLIQWYTGTGTTAPISGATTATLSGLAAGDYTVEVIDILSPGNTCLNVATFTITDDIPIYSINKAAITITDQSDCVANGSAIITDVLIDGVSNGGVAGFTFNWLDDSNVAIAGAGNAATISVPLAAGDYRVMATNIASNCSSVITVFTVKDISVNPVIAVSTLINNSNCNVAAANGSVTINVNGGAPAPTAFSIQWFTGIGTTTPIVGATAATVSALIAGDYTVQVTDILSPGNTCSTVSTFTINNTPNVVALDNSLMTLTNNSNCSPLNGSATITKVLFNGTQDGNTSNYTFEWLRADLTIADASTTAIVGAPLDAGNYFVRATHLASTCASAPTPFTIKSTTQIPVVVALKNKDNIACNASYTGQVSASVSEGFTNGVTAGYLFEWFKGTNNTNGADFIAAGTSLSNLQEGAYTVRVTDTSAPSKNCANITTINVGRQIPVLNGTLIASPQTACAPIQDGKIVANTVQVFVLSTSTSYDMNVTADRNKFTFQWYNESLTPITGPITGNNNSPFLEGGIYYNRLTDGLGCTSDYIKETIDDTTVKPAVSVQEFVNPAVCVLPELKGSILVTADGNPNFSDYTFEWHEGNNTAGPLVEPNSPFLTNISYTGPGQYTVKVSNNATQCVTLETYRFTTDTLAIKVIASAVPLTSCVADNGSLFAATRTGSGQLYNIEWYIGSNVGNVPDFTGNEVLIAPVGTYTAIAKHPTLAFCESIPDVVSITDERLYPTVMATQKDPVTYCDPTNPNGVAFASVNGNITYYTFDWYEDALTGKLAYTGSEAGVLKAITYIVKGTDIISGCYGTASVAMTSDILAVPSPDIMLVSDLADCVAPDGALSAAVKGITKDHIFSWYAGTTIKTQPDAIGEIFTGLVDGTYSVTATDRETGCTSPPVQGVIANIQRYPEFDIKTVSTSCDGAIGTAQIFASNDDEVQFVKWDIAGDIENGPQVINLPSGTFSVTVVTVKDCEATKSFLVNSDIVIYNGVSRNNDGKNDIFELGCIAEYPNNSVRIFNRSGSLVYEAKGYDNQDIYFNGISNRGVNILGNDLPDGTYFYIISKGDGSEDRTGYLELLH
ncbi:MAG: gliding motility-associated C-terminal domain-containing protein, partial [Chryseolinea sp.]